MLIKDVLQHKGSEVLTIGSNSTALDAVEALNNKKVGSLIVVGRDGEVVGILSERDILAHFRESIDGVPVTKIMTPRDKLIIGHEPDSVEYAMSMMTEHRIRHLPIFDDNKLIGLVSIGDVVKAVSEDLEFEAKQLEEYIADSHVVVP